MQRSTTKAFKVLVLSAILAVFTVGSAAAAESKFIKDFSENYYQNKFQALEYLIKKNNDSVPAEVRAAVQDALSGDKPYDEKMRILDLANSIASMYNFTYKDESLVKEVEAVLHDEMKKEQDRLAEAQKWDKFEKTLGNTVMKTRAAEMEARGLTPVIFPHWIHRLYYECTACHKTPFEMKRATDVTQANILEGKQCGACHNGKTAFGADADCNRCHAAGKPEADALQNVTKPETAKIKETAARLGGEFKPELLTNNALPLDKFGIINWPALMATNAIKRVKTADGKAAGEVRDSTIIFEPTVDGIKSVPFSHKLHSAEINCATCHAEVFKDQLGGNAVTMKEMSGGNYCGYCHARVSFKFSDCNRCHSLSKGEKIPGALIRNGNKK